MINVMGGYLKISGDGKRNQRSGVRSARERAINMGSRCRKLATIEKRAEIGQSSASPWRRPSGCFNAVTDLR